MVALFLAPTVPGVGVGPLLSPAIVLGLPRFSEKQQKVDEHGPVLMF